MFPDLNFLLTQYCSDILLLEAIRQILPWRTRVRTSAELLSPQEEQCLYDKGEELLHETDWVLRFREWKAEADDESALNRAPKKSGGRSIKLTVRLDRFFPQTCPRMQRVEEDYSFRSHTLP